MKKKTFKLATLGCRTNQYETQAFRDQLQALGYSEAKQGQSADLCIVNTCTVTESADKSSLTKIRQMASLAEGQVVVTGCMAKKAQELFKENQKIKVFLNEEKENLIEKLFPDESVPEFSIKNFEAHTRAFVKVQDGCNSFCTYCIIPYVRGRSRCRPAEDVLKEVRNLIESGYKEIVITGINVGDYLVDGCNLAELMRRVDKVPGIERLRLSSIDPDEVDDDLMDAVINGQNTCPSLHIVLQSGSNFILKKMNRKYTRQVFLNTVRRLKNAQKDFTFTTDVIVGFPGETEEDFQQTLEIMEEVKFAKVHMFPYSPRERTRAFSYENKVMPEVIFERKQQVLRLSEKIGYDLREEYVGREMTVLTENSDKDRVFGHTDNFLPVFFSKFDVGSNELLKVKILKNTPEGLLGQPIS